MTTVKLRPIHVSPLIWTAPPFDRVSNEAKYLYCALAARYGKGGRSVIIMREEIFPDANESDIAEWWLEIRNLDLIKGGPTGTLDVDVFEHEFLKFGTVSTGKKSPIPLAVRRAIALAHGGIPGETVTAKCAYCDFEGTIQWPMLYTSERPGAWVTFGGLEMDHIYPESLGGPTTPENMTLACKPCNRRKGAKPLGPS